MSLFVSPPLAVVTRGLIAKSIGRDDAAVSSNAKPHEDSVYLILPTVLSAFMSTRSGPQPWLGAATLIGGRHIKKLHSAANNSYFHSNFHYSHTLDASCHIRSPEPDVAELSFALVWLPLCSFLFRYKYNSQALGFHRFPDPSSRNNPRLATFSFHRRQ